MATKAQFALFSTKCEFLRQFAVEIPSDQWKNLVSLRIYNHDTEQWASGAIELSKTEYLTKLLRGRMDVKPGLASAPVQHRAIFRFSVRRLCFA